MNLLMIFDGNALYLRYTLCCLIETPFQKRSGALENAGWYSLNTIFQASIYFIYSRMVMNNLTYNSLHTTTKKTHSL